MALYCCLFIAAIVLGFVDDFVLVQLLPFCYVG